MFVPKGPIDNIPVLVQIMAWCRPGDKPLSEPIMWLTDPLGQSASISSHHENVLPRIYTHVANLSCHWFTQLFVTYSFSWPSYLHYGNVYTSKDCLYNEMCPRERWVNINGLVQERRNSIALAMELRLSYTNPSICKINEIQPKHISF